MDSRDPGTYIRNMTFALMAGQSGCGSVVLIMAMLLGGLWLDALFDTRPAFTLVLLLLSIPLSLGLMLYMVLSATSRISPPPKAASSEKREEKDQNPS